MSEQEVNPLNADHERKVAETIYAPTPAADSEGVDLDTMWFDYGRLLANPNKNRNLLRRHLDSVQVEITRLRAALDDKVSATADYEAVALAYVMEVADYRCDNGVRASYLLTHMAAELRHHRAVEAASGPRTVKLCDECGKGYLPREGCLRCAKEDSLNALWRLHQIIKKAGVANLARGVQLGQVSWCVKANSAMEQAYATLTKHSPPEQAKEDE